MAAVDRQPQPAARPSSRSCSRSSRPWSSRWPSSAAGGCTRWAPSTCCPSSTAAKLKAAEEATRDVDGMLVNIAVGYGGRREITDAVRSLLSEHASRGTSLEELAQILDVEHIAEHLYTKGQPDPDLVIRTSGEQRLGGFLLWQSAKSSSTSARPTGRTSAASTSSARSGPTPSASAASAPDVPAQSARLRRHATGSPPAVGRVAPGGTAAARRRTFAGIGEWGSLPYREARILREHDPTELAGSAPCVRSRSGAAHVTASGAGTPAFGLPPGPSATAFRTGRGVRVPVCEG